MKTFPPNEVERNAHTIGLIAFGLLVILPTFGIFVVIPLAAPLLGGQAPSTRGAGVMVVILLGSLVTLGAIYYAVRRWILSGPLLYVDEEGMRIKGNFPAKAKSNWSLKWSEIRQVEKVGKDPFQALQVWTNQGDGKPYLLRYDDLDEIGKLVYQYCPQAGKAWEPRLEPAVTKDSDVPNAASDIENLLRNHLKRLKSKMSSHPGAAEIERAIAYLLQVEPLSFTVSTIEKNLAEALAEKKALETSFYFPSQLGEAGNWIVVTVFPWLTPAEVRANLPSGYSQKLKELDVKVGAIDIRPPTELAKRPLVWTNLVHWIYCSDGHEAGVHLTYVPQASNPRARRSFVLVAEDLLTPEEKRKMGMRR
jgi:hypothetical protein